GYTQPVLNRPTAARASLEPHRAEARGLAVDGTATPYGAADARERLATLPLEASNLGKGPPLDEVRDGFARCPVDSRAEAPDPLRGDDDSDSLPGVLRGLGIAHGPADGWAPSLHAPLLGISAKLTNAVP